MISEEDRSASTPSGGQPRTKNEVERRFHLKTACVADGFSEM
ncbi:MAG: hypothetical protein NTY46_07330 [Candidatus Sumerlaeota bacterium]|nr:hypothetical protein [Candidatus Sumerlaeota bacterium]